MDKNWLRIMCFCIALLPLGHKDIRAEVNNNKSLSTTDTSKNSPSDSKSSSNSFAAPAVSSLSSTSACTSASCVLSTVGLAPNVQAASVQVEPSTGSANLSIPIQIPPGRAGIQPDLSVVYSSSNRQLGNAGVGWSLDLGSIQISTKKGVPKYDGTDIMTMEKDGGIQDLVADPSVSGLYHMEVEGAFAKIEFFTTYWLVTDKKGVKYYYGNTADSKQADPGNPGHIFRWALNRVEDLNGNYMTISYLNDQGQIYPQTISYTGNDQSSLLLSPYVKINISYVAASVPSSSYISKFLVQTAQRLDHITVNAGPNLYSMDTFTYHQSAYSHRDLLQSVQQTGADGSSVLPAVTFTYSDTAPKGFALDPSWDLSHVPYFGQYANNIWQDLGVRFADLNGDGYPDEIQYSAPWGGSVTDQVYLNTTAKSWSPTGNWQPSMVGIPDFPPSNCGFITYVELNRYTGLTLLDADGDGQPDVIQNFKRDQYWGNGGQNLEEALINNGTNSYGSDGSWILPSDAIIDYQLGEPVYEYTVPGATAFGSIDGAGYADIAVSRTDWYPSHNVYLNNETSGSKGWTLSSQWVTPSNVDFNKGGAMVDLNGDGLADIITLTGDSAQIYMNTGNGWQLQSGSGYASTNGLGDLTNGTTEFVDVNGDGLPDMVIGNGSSSHVLINTGNGWVQDDSWVPPGGFSFAQFSQFLDANADGMADYMVSYPGTKQMYTNQGQPADLLVSINNGIGATTAITYNSSFHYQNTYMPYFTPVVASTTTAVLSQNYMTNYTYAGGLWDKVYREFDGFHVVTVTDPDGNYETTTYLQDHWLKGRPAEQDTYDAGGNLYTKSINTWQTQVIATNNSFLVGGTAQVCKFPFISRSDHYLYDGNNSAIPKRTAQEFSYAENPQYGDPTQAINDGQVDPSAGTSIDPNKTISNMTYVNNAANGLTGLPAVVSTQDVNGNQIGKTSYYYDGDTTGSAVPSLGRLTMKVDWLGSPTQPDPKTTYSYDGYGNLLTTTDPNGNTTAITYDNTVHMFPEKTTNALNQSMTMTYYGVDSVSLDNGAGLHGLWGQEAGKTDANGQTAYTTFDTFGRPSTSISPLDSASLPTEQKTYNLQPAYIEVTDTVRTTSGSTATISSTSFYDGLGRLIESKSLGQTAGQYIASGQTVYDNRGLPTAQYLPYFTSNNLDTMDPMNTSNPASETAYDAMGRVITKTNPDGTYSNISYNQWTTSTVDENGHKQQNTVDAFGRLAQKMEYTGADGRSPYYPSSAYTVYATTSYAYDPRGDLLSVTDAHNNATTVSYDHLGRKIAMNDPDMGKWQYSYDSNGNLISQTDSKGQVISFKYDALNRLINKTDATASFNVAYNFDDKSQSYGMGRLGSVSYNGGTAGFIYDQLGREVVSNKSIGGVNYSVVRLYDDLNRLQLLQYPDGAKADYTYNQAGQVTGISSQ